MSGEAALAAAGTAGAGPPAGAAGWQAARPGRAQLWGLATLAGLALLMLLDASGLFGESGIIKLEWFTEEALSHGRDPCSWDYEGSWAIGAAGGSPANATFSPHAVISCKQIGDNPPASFAADPFLHRPGPKEDLPDGGSAKWYAFYELKNLLPYKGEIGVAVSSDNGATWAHQGVVLDEPFHLSYPWVTYDAVADVYIMIPETAKAYDGGVRVYTTTRDSFPRGWSLQRVVRPGGERGVWLDTTPVLYDNTWLVYVTKRGVPARGQPKYTLRLFTAGESLLVGDWAPHPAAPGALDTSRRTARNGGRAFVLDGVIHRWAQDCEGGYGTAVALMRVDSPLDADAGGTAVPYKETQVALYRPGTADRFSYRSVRGHHMDMQQLPDGSWVGLTDGDDVMDGNHHFIVRELWFVQLKGYIAIALALVLVLVLARWAVGVCLAAPAAAPLARALAASHRAASERATACAEAFGPALTGLRCCAVAVLGAHLIMYCFPRVVPCTPGLPYVKVQPAHVPHTPHIDYAAPYNLSSIAVITACSVGFFDRIQNLVGSLQYWEPRLPIYVFDVGFSRDQMRVISCWKNVKLLRFPWEEFPPHVHNLTNFAFKGALHGYAMRELKDHNAILWLDCGLEPRAPLTELFSTMSRYGHVSVEQPDAMHHPALEEVIVPYLGIPNKLYQSIKHLPMCAGGVQGWVRNSDADRLILKAHENCSLNTACITPPLAVFEARARGIPFMHDQMVVSVLNRANNFTTCLSRDTHLQSSVKKGSWDPLQLSGTVKLLSRRHRQPKAYAKYVQYKDKCHPRDINITWQPMLPRAGETVVKSSSLAYKIMYMYGQAFGDFLIQAGCCDGMHILTFVLFWLLWSCKTVPAMRMRIGAARAALERMLAPLLRRAGYSPLGNSAGVGGGKGASPSSLSGGDGPDPEAYDSKGHYEQRHSRSGYEAPAASQMVVAAVFGAIVLPLWSWSSMKVTCNLP